MSPSGRHGIIEQTIYTWRKRFETFQAADVRRLKQLEAENARLKKLVLLCHKILCCDGGLTAALQHEHLERRLARATVSHRRMVAIELGM